MQSRPWQGSLIAVLSAVVLLALAQSALAARTAYFADPGTDEIAQFAVGPGGALTPLGAASARDAYRLAMTPDGAHLYATAGDDVRQFDVAADDGRLTAMDSVDLPHGAFAHSIAIHPSGSSAYVTDARYGKVRQYDIGADGALTPKDPPSLAAGPAAKGVAVSPDGHTAYVLVAGGIALFAIHDDGALESRETLEVDSCLLQDVALTPDGHNLYATSRDGRVLQFGVDDTGALTPKSPAAIEVDRGDQPFGLAVAPDGSAVYVSTRGWFGWSRDLYAFAVGADGTLAPGTPPSLAVPTWKLSYLAASPDGRSLFAAGRNAFMFDIGPGAAIAPKDPASVDLDRATGVVVSPNQAPQAGFNGPAAVAGQQVQFDGGASVDPDGSIVRYDWDFGDGTTLPDGGPTPTHVYTSPGSFTVTLAVTDNEGASTRTVFTGGTVLGRGTPGAQASRVIVVAAAAQAPPPPLPPALPPVGAQPLRPDLGETLLAAPAAGTIRVKVPGSRRFRPLRSLRELPMGSTIDSRRGRVKLTTVRNRTNRLQHADFRGGLFKVRQRKRDKYITELVLQGPVGPCPRGDAGAAAKRRTRKLWGSGKGRYRSRGRYSSASVRGTRWLVEDRCDGTLTVVRRGVVAVRDFARDRTVVLQPGERYLAHP
ncbi:MAG TPA: PKD domain-containing protein [Thermoleophilaceae bacterium]